jgi:hypothetical protein
MKLHSLVHASDDELTRACRHALCNLATDDEFFELVPVMEWTDIVTDLLNEHPDSLEAESIHYLTALMPSAQPDVSTAVWLIGIIARRTVLGESLVTHYLETSLNVLEHQSGFLDDVHDALVAIRNLLMGLEVSHLRRIARLFADVFKPGLLQIARYVNFHAEAELVLSIFRMLISVGVGAEVILTGFSACSMFLVLSGLEDDALRCSILDFLCFCAQSGIPHIEGRMIGAAMEIAEMGNFGERRSAMRFLCAIIEEPERPDVSARLYPLIGDFLISVDKVSALEMMHSVLHLLTVDLVFRGFIASNEEYIQALEEITDQTDGYLGDRDFNEAVHGIRAILGELKGAVDGDSCF